MIRPSVWLPQVSAVWDSFHLRDYETAAFTICGERIERGELSPSKGFVSGKGGKANI